MLIDFETAVSIFEKIPLASRLPSFHPSYLVADAARECGATRPVFFLYQEAAHVFYFPFLLGPIPGTPFFDIQSPYGYGGPLLSSQDPEFLNRAYRAYRAWCAEQNVVAEFIRFHPLAENWQSYDGERLYNRETVWLDLAADSAYEQRVRTALKKAAKDLSIRFSDAAQSLDHFREIYWQGMQAIGAQPFYMFKNDYFEAFKGWKDFFCLFAFLEEHCVAAAMFLRTGQSMEYHLSACLEAGRKFSATNLLIHEAAQIGKAAGVQSLHLGGGTSSVPEDKLLFFKRGFSPLRSRFYIGKKILNPIIYDQLKADWQKKNGVVNNNILFYR